MTKPDKILEKISFNIEGNYYSLLDMFYPIGTVYMSHEPTSPVVLFGGGTWVQIENRVIRGANNVNSGGSDDMIIPYHNHSTTVGNQTANHYHSIGSHKHYITSYSNYSRVYGMNNTASNISTYMGNSTSSGGETKMAFAPFATGRYSGGSDTCKLIADDINSYSSGNNSGDHKHTVTVNYAGETVTNKNLPAYQNLYVWYRKN